LPKKGARFDFLDVVRVEAEKTVVDQPLGIDQVEVAVEFVEDLLVDPVVQQDVLQPVHVRPDTGQLVVVVVVVAVVLGHRDERVLDAERDAHVGVAREVRRHALRRAVELDGPDRLHLDAVRSRVVTLRILRTAPAGTARQPTRDDGEAPGRYVCSACDPATARVPFHTV
jgi:hypothetical protein